MKPPSWIYTCALSSVWHGSSCGVMSKVNSNDVSVYHSDRAAVQCMQKLYSYSLPFTHASSIISIMCMFDCIKVCNTQLSYFNNINKCSVNSNLNWMCVNLLSNGSTRHLADVFMRIEMRNMHCLHCGYVHWGMKRAPTNKLWGRGTIRLGECQDNEKVTVKLN